MDVKNLDSVSREEQKAILSNVISRCIGARKRRRVV